MAVKKLNHFYLYLNIPTCMHIPPPSKRMTILVELKKAIDHTTRPINLTGKLLHIPSDDGYFQMKEAVAKKKIK